MGESTYLDGVLCIISLSGAVPGKAGKAAALPRFPEKNGKGKVSISNKLIAKRLVLNIFISE